MSAKQTVAKYEALVTPWGNKKRWSMLGRNHMKGLTINRLDSAAVRPQPIVIASKPFRRTKSSSLSQGKYVNDLQHFIPLERSLRVLQKMMR